MARARVRSMVWALVAVIGALLVALWPAQAGQGPPSIPGNPGVPGLLAQIEALNAQIATLQGQLAAKDAAIATLQGQLAAQDAEIAALQGQVATLENQARVARTGQTALVATGDDGDIQAGVPFPTPRFTDNADGTVTDNLTGLIWLHNANCFGGQTWANALNAANALASGSCGLLDGSVAGDWRLPNIKELQSLIDFSKINLALPAGHPFSSAQSAFYWSSTTFPGLPVIAWLVNLIDRAPTWSTRGTPAMCGRSGGENRFFEPLRLWTLWGVQGGVPPATPRFLAEGLGDDPLSEAAHPVP